MSVRILSGDCREVLRSLPAESVHCVVTSPPYWGLRDYGTAKWEGGEEGCDHLDEPMRTRAYINQNCGTGNDVKNAEGRQPFKAICKKCGARRIDSQIGLEATIGEYVETMVAVFREVRRVLRKDGTLWLNLGDSYASGEIGRHDGGRTYQDTYNRKSFGPRKQYSRPRITGQHRGTENVVSDPGSDGAPTFIKPKDLCGIPWRVAFALQADGWWLRQDIIWFKKNPMPESVNDRCTKAHEYLFMLSNSANYYYDAEAIKEDSARPGETSYTTKTDGLGEGYDGHRTRKGLLRGTITEPTRNRRSVWEIATAPFPEAHFATFPPALVDPCIRAGTSEKGCCAKCGAPWVREVERIVEWEKRTGRNANKDRADGGMSCNAFRESKTIGWSPSCSCAAAAVPCTILDCFGGAGTTGLVADRLGRNAVLIELNPEYVAMAEKRLRGDAPLFAEVAAE